MKYSMMKGNINAATARARIKIGHTPLVASLAMIAFGAFSQTNLSAPEVSGNDARTAPPIARRGTRTLEKRFARRR